MELNSYCSMLMINVFIGTNISIYRARACDNNFIIKTKHDSLCLLK